MLLRFVAIDSSIDTVSSVISPVPYFFPHYGNQPQQYQSLFASTNHNNSNDSKNLNSYEVSYHSHAPQQQLHQQHQLKQQLQTLAVTPASTNSSQNTPFQTYPSLFSSPSINSSVTSSAPTPPNIHQSSFHHQTIIPTTTQIGTRVAAPPNTVISTVTSTPNVNTRTATAFSFVSTPLAQPEKKKRPRRKWHEIDRNYSCHFCDKSYGTLNHLNAHIGMSLHGQKRKPDEFKEMRKVLRIRKKEQQMLLKRQQEFSKRNVASSSKPQQDPLSSASISQPTTVSPASVEFANNFNAMSLASLFDDPQPYPNTDTALQLSQRHQVPSLFPPQMLHCLRAKRLPRYQEDIIEVKQENKGNGHNGDNDE